jgi:hypothetical protein
MSAADAIRAREQAKRPKPPEPEPVKVRKPKPPEPVADTLTPDEFHVTFGIPDPDSV